MLRRIWAITQKEFIQMFRDRRTFLGLLIGPMVELILFGAAIHTDIRHIPMVVADQSMSQASRLYLTAFVDSQSFDIVASVSGQADLLRAIDGGQASLGMLIPPDFAMRTVRGDATVLMLVDGSTSFTSTIAYNTANAISQQYAVSLISSPTQHVDSPLTTHIQILYNPDLKDLWLITPGFIAMLLQAIAGNMTALAIVRERERGTIEALLVTPIRPFELMLAKMIPNLLLAFASALLLLLDGSLILGVPFRGSFLLFSALSMIAIGCGLGLGLMISSAVQTQNQAWQLNSLVNMTGMFLGGLLYPTYALPSILRALSYIIPMSYFIPILRGISLKGVGLADLWLQALPLTLLLGVTLFIASRLFRQRLD